MPIGPGKYDKLAEMCLSTTNAEAVVVIVFNGNRGSGMSAKVKLGADFEIAIRNMQVVADLPKVLRHVADSIERDTPGKN